MKIKILIILLIVAIAIAQQTNIVLSLNIKYNNGVITNEGMKLIEGNAPDRLNQPQDGYLVKVIDFKGDILYSFNFLFELRPVFGLKPEWFDENGTQIYFPNETAKELKETTEVLSIPYFRNAKSIDIYDPQNKLVLSIDISNLATCNMNNVCEPNESDVSCPEDCRIASVGSDMILYVAGIVVILIIVGAVYYLKRGKKKKK